MKITAHTHNRANLHHASTDDVELDSAVKLARELAAMKRQPDARWKCSR